jgi:hypothetical protein
MKSSIVAVRVQQMNRSQRGILYMCAAVIAAGHYWIFLYFAGLETGIQRSVWTAASLGFLVVGWIAVAFWASSDFPKRTRLRGTVRASVMILAGTGGLLQEVGFDNGVWSVILLAVAAIFISELFLRSKNRNEVIRQSD